MNSNLCFADLIALPKFHRILPNGLKVFMVQYPSPGVVAFHIPVRVGSRNEVEKGKTGFAHFFEHLMFRGTKKLSAKEFGDIYHKYGCENNAYTSRDITNYHGVVSKKYFSKILEAEADRFQNLYFDEKALKDEAGAVLGEYNKDVAQPEFLLEEALYQAAFTKHTYGHTTMGYKEDVLAFPQRYKDVWPFFRRYYRPQNTSIILVGDVDFNKDYALIAKYFGAWSKKGAENLPVIEEEPVQEKGREVNLNWPKPMQTRIVLAYKTPGFSSRHKDTAVSQLIHEVLFSEVSQFQKIYRFEKKWIDSVGASGIDSIDPGLITVSLRLTEDGLGKESQLIEAVRNTLLAMPSEEDLSAAKKRWRGGMVTKWFSDPDELAGRLAWFINLEPDFGVIDRFLASIESVNLKELQDFQKKYFKKEFEILLTMKGEKS